MESEADTLLLRLETMIGFGGIIQGQCDITPNKLQQFSSLLFHVLCGPLHHQKSPRDSVLCFISVAVWPNCV